MSTQIVPSNSENKQGPTTINKNNTESIDAKNSDQIEDNSPTSPNNQPQSNHNNQNNQNNQNNFNNIELERQRIIRQKLRKITEQCLMFWLLLFLSFLIDFIGISTINAKPRTLHEPRGKHNHRIRDRSNSKSKRTNHQSSHNSHNSHTSHNAIHDNGPVFPPKYFQKPFSQQYRLQAIDSIHDMFDHGFYKFSLFTFIHIYSHLFYLYILLIYFILIVICHEHFHMMN